MAIGVSQAFKDAMRAPVKVLRASITTEDNVAHTSSDDLTNFAVETSGYYFGATTKAISFNLLGTTYNLLDKYVRVTLSVQTDSVNDTWEDCFLGKFKIYEQNANLEKETTSFKAYDIIGVMANDYYTEGSLSFPCTIEGLVEQISQRYGLSYTPGNLVNGSHNITEDLYAKINNITFRDILAEIAGATATIALVDGLANTLELREPSMTPSETWTYDNLKSIKFEPKYGAINAVTLSREPAGDNVSVIYEPVISGEGTEIEFTDINRFKSVEMHGDTDQQTYSGKNLAKTTDCNISGTGYTMQITNGYIEISTQSNNSAFDICGGTRLGTWLPTYSSAPDYHLTRADGGTYVLKCFDTTGTSITGTKNNILRIYTNQRQVDGILWSSGYYDTLTITLNQDEYIKDIVVWTNGDDSSVTLKFKPQLEKGSTATSYEPYVGGTASPNPDYPQDVNVVTGEQVVTVTGKNLLNLVPKSTLSNGITTTLNADGSLTCSGTATSIWADITEIVSLPKTLSSSDVLVFSIQNSLPVQVIARVVIPSPYLRKDYAISAGDTSSSPSTVGIAAQKVYLFISGMTIGTTYNFTIKQAQLELGSQPTPYVPYNTQTYEVNLGSIELCKLGDYEDYIYKNGDKWYLHKEVRHISLNVSDMNNSEDYAGWKDVEHVASDLGTGRNTSFDSITQVKNNIISHSGALRLNTNSGNSTVFMPTYAYPYLTQTEWMNTYPNLVSEIYYGILNRTSDTEITNATLKSQLNALSAAKISSKKTYISVSGDMPAILDIDAFENVPDIKEIKLANNEILDDNRESMITPILNSVNGFEFYPFEATTEGHGWHECGDRISVTDGTNTWDVIITYTKITIDGGIKETIKGVRPDESQTNYALAGGIMKTIYNTEIKVDKQGQEITSIVSRQDTFENQTLENFSQITQNINSVTTTIQTTGGGNLVHNSVGYNKETNGALVNWSVTGTVISESSPESLSYGAISGSQIDLRATSSIIQRITVDGSGSQLYTLSLRAKKGATGVATIHLRNDIDDYTVNIPAGSSVLWEQYSIVGVEPHSVYFDVVVETDSSVTELSITDLMLSVGDSTTPWVSASDEILSKNVAVDNSGVTVRSNTTNDYTQLNELGLNGYSDASGTMENVFTVNRDTTEVSKLKARKQISMSPIKIVPVTSGNRAGWSFTKES